MTPTEQQLNCITLAAKEPLLKVVACAGSGKTSTLELIASSLVRPSIYLAFNKVTATEAEGRFPSHVVCKTTHSVAYRVFGAPLQAKLTRPSGAYRNVAGTPSEIARYYKVEAVDGVATTGAMGLYVKMTVERFEQSADMEMGLKHVPTNEMEKVLKEDPSAASEVLKCAKRLWRDRIDTKSGVLATHDTYVKLFQLSKPVLPYEVIYVDEFQDTTPCVMDILESQHATATVIMVGDPRQAIYGWRGAVNAMERVCCKSAPLSQSFRYGQGIADVASAILHHDMIVVGRTDIDTKVGYNVVDRSKAHMYLFRTNALLLLEAVAAIDRGEKVKVEIDVRDFVKVLQSAVALFTSDTKGVKHERILPYASWEAMKREAEQVGGELKRLVGLVEGEQAAHVIEVLEAYTEPHDAVAIYTSAHKAKGRDANQVILASDFPSNYKEGKWVGVTREEENLLYVAVTRAKHVLEINAPVQEVMEKYKMPYLGESPHDIAEQVVLAKKPVNRKNHRDPDFERLFRQEHRLIEDILDKGNNYRGWDKDEY